MGTQVSDSTVEKKAKESNTSKAYLELKQKILNNDLPAGYQKTEPEIAELLGMSRTPVREALVKLASEGLIEMIPRRGVRVLPIQMSDMRDIYQLLMVLEPEAAANIATDGLPPLIEARLEQCLNTMEDALLQDDLDSWARADDNFHRTLLSVSNNERLIAIVNNLFDQAHRARMVTLRLREKPVKSTFEHRKILAAINNGDAELTRQLFREHRRYSSTELLEKLDELKINHF